MTRALAFVLFACTALSACVMSDFPLHENGQPIYPPEIIAALPEGVPPAIVFLAVDGCYAYSIEVSEPPTGFPLYGRDGERICNAEAQARIAAQSPAATPDV